MSRESRVRIEDWPKPRPLKEELPPVIAFDDDLLPESVRSFVMDVAERMQVPADFAAVGTVIGLAGAVNRRARIQPKLNDDTWNVIPNLWGGLIGPPGSMKSPLMAAVLWPLTTIDQEWQRDNTRRLKQYEQSSEDWETRRKQRADPNEKQHIIDERPEKPVAKRLIVNDSTFEKLHELMRENPAGIFVVRDELTGWLAELNRAGREGERAFYLQAWNGDTGHTIDRIGRGFVHVPACCLSMMGGIQPERLKAYLAERGSAIQDDGLIQRFQLLVWPDQSDDFEYVDRKPDRLAQERMQTIFRRLTEIDDSTPLRFRFDDEAQEFFIGFFHWLEAELRSDTHSELMGSHLAKYRSLMPALALLLELAELAAGFEGFGGLGDKASKTFVVTFENAHRAHRWCDYLQTHARRVYSLVGCPQSRAAMKLADKIRTRAVGADRYFTARDVAQHDWKGLNSPEEVRAAAILLEQAGWIRDATERPGPKGGRPSDSYEVNPKIWE